MVKRRATIYAGLFNQYKIKNHLVFSARFHNQDEVGQVLDDIEIHISVIIITIKLDLNFERRRRNQEAKCSGWRFDKIISMTLFCFQTMELNDSNYAKSPSGNSAILNLKKNQYSFLWSILAHSQPCEKSHPARVSKNKQNFQELKFQ